MNRQRERIGSIGDLTGSGQRVLSAFAITFIVAVVLGAAMPTRAVASVITFDFDTGEPVLPEGRDTPLDQTSNGVTAHYSSPSDPATFSVQSYGTTFLTLSQFSGKYLYDNKGSRDYLDVLFDAPITSANFTFATVEAHGGPGTDPCLVTLTAYMDSTANPPVGTDSARGTWSNDSYPQGQLNYASGGVPFNIIRIYMPYQRPGVTDFLVDTFVVITADNSDVTPPQTSIDLSGTQGSLGWYRSDVTVSLSATDDKSGVNTTEYSFDSITWTTYAAPFIVSSEGTINVYYRSTDHAGNIEAMKVQALKIDKTDPVTTLSFYGILGNMGWFTSPITVTLSATDSLSGVAGTEYSYDGINWTSYAGPFGLGTQGRNVVHFRSTDYAGNVETEKTQPAKVDTVAPTGAIIIRGGGSANPSNSVVRDTAVTFDAGTSSDNVGIVAYEWNCGDGTNDTGTAITHTYNVPGTYLVTLTVRDEAGNAGSQALDITVLERDSSNQVFLVSVFIVITVLLSLLAAAIFVARRRRRQG